MGDTEPTLLLARAEVFRIKGRGTVVAGIGAKAPFARIGDTVQLRHKERVVCCAMVRGLEMLNLSLPPPPDRKPYGILIDEPDVVIESDDLSVWLLRNDDV